MHLSPRVDSLHNHQSYPHSVKFSFIFSHVIGTIHLHKVLTGNQHKILYLDKVAQCLNINVDIFFSLASLLRWLTHNFASANKILWCHA